MSEGESEKPAEGGDTANAGAASAKPEAAVNKGLRTAIFAGILIGVVVVFQLMYVFQDPPPDMPKDELHTLRLNTENELIGVGDLASWPTTDASGQPLPMEKKAIERRANLYCARCHGAPPGLRDEEFNAFMQCAVPTKCLPTKENHPPKETCIKCHRMPGSK